MSFRDTALLLAWIGIGLLALALSGLLRQVHVLTSALEGLGHRRATVASLVGRAVHPIDKSDGVLTFSRPTLLLFIESGCPSCDGALAVARDVAPRAGLDVVGLVAGEALPPGANGTRVLVGQARLFDELGVVVTPLAAVVGSDGIAVASGPVGSPQSVTELVTEATERMANG